MITVKNLKKYFKRRRIFTGSIPEVTKAVDDISFSVTKGKTFGLVGGSGSGKTTVAKLLTGMLKPDAGDIFLDGGIDMVFQDPFGSLNPRMNVREIVGEPLLINGVGEYAIDDKVAVIIKNVRMSRDDLYKYPYQFSGGERQRIAIARAIVRSPSILVLDEPVSSLDVSIQASILNLLKDLQEEMGLTYIFISHDLRVVEFISDTVGVMQAGKIVEMGPSKTIYKSPKDPYTRQLLEAIPKI